MAYFLLLLSCVSVLSLEKTVIVPLNYSYSLVRCTRQAMDGKTVSEENASLQTPLPNSKSRETSRLNSKDSEIDDNKSEETTRQADSL